MNASSFATQLQIACYAEFARFDRGTRTETQAPQYRYVGEYWNALGIQYNGRTVSDGLRPPWSSAFVSFVVKKAGAGQRFHYSQAHCHYVNAAMQLARGIDSVHGYIARRPSSYAPKVGDIVVAGRGSAKSYNYDQAEMMYTSNSFYPSHGDIVVEVRPNSIVTIGGNVTRDTVGRRIRKIDAYGKLKDRVERGKNYPWIAVLQSVL